MKRDVIVRSDSLKIIDLQVDKQEFSNYVDYMIRYIQDIEDIPDVKRAIKLESIITDDNSPVGRLMKIKEYALKTQEHIHNNPTDKIPDMSEIVQDLNDIREELVPKPNKTWQDSRYNGRHGGYVPRK